MDYEKFSTDRLEFEDFDVKSGKPYVTGYISTDEVDIQNEVVTPEAMKSLVAQLNSGNLKLDWEHEHFVKDLPGSPTGPLGRFVEAKAVYEGGKHKVWIKAELNQDYKRVNKEGVVIKSFAEIWSEIKNRFLDAFSIAYRVKDKVERVINGVTVTLLKSIDLLNVALTGDPVNRGARMQEAFVKSASALHTQEVSKMVEPQNVQAAADEASKLQLKNASEIEALNKSLSEANTGLKTQEETIAELKAILSKSVESSEKQRQEITELKAILEKPQFKALATRDEPKNTESIVRPLDSIL